MTGYVLFRKRDPKFRLTSPATSAFPSARASRLRVEPSLDIVEEFDHVPFSGRSDGNSGFLHMLEKWAYHANIAHRLANILGIFSA